MITDYVEVPAAWRPHTGAAPRQATSRGSERCAAHEARIAELEARLARAERILLLTDTRNQLRARSAAAHPASGPVTLEHYPAHS